MTIPYYSLFVIQEWEFRRRRFRVSLSASIESTNPGQAVGPDWAYRSRSILSKRMGARSGQRVPKGEAVRFISQFPAKRIRKNRRDLRLLGIPHPVVVHKLLLHVNFVLFIFGA